MRRFMITFLAMIALSIRVFNPSMAQMEADWANSAEILPTLGFPELVLRESGSGIESPPSELAAGYYHVILEAPSETPVYVNFVQIPAGLSDAEAEAQLLVAARDDMPALGWTFGGGSFADPGTVVHFVVALTEGDWHIASTHEVASPVGDREEVPVLYPLRVTAGSAPEPAAPPATITVELSDFAVGGLERSIAAGPAVWELRGTGEQPHHLVLVRTPHLVTAEEVASWIEQLFSGTPPDAIPGWNELVGVGYSALLSPGRVVWTEFDLTPGTYAALCFIFDPASSMPHLMLGMVQGFTVA